MKLLNAKTALVATLLGAGILTATVIVPYARRQMQAAEYPTPPFAPFPADWPALVSDRERPNAANKKEYEQYLAERRKAAAFYREQGAQARLSPAEREALECVWNDEHVAGWEKAVAILKDNPNSICGLYCLATAEQAGERNFARALHVARQARRLCEEHGRANPNDADAREWYIRVSLLEEDVLSALERFDEVLTVITNLERAYRPMPERRHWPLVKLNRIEEAEAANAEAEATGRWTRSSLNTRLIFASLRRQRAACYRLGQEIARQAESSPVIWSNLGDSALCDFRHKEAEEHLLKAAGMGKMNFNGSPWTTLGNIYVDAGRFDEALAARGKAILQRGERASYTLAYDQGRSDASLARLLLATGHSLDGERLARRSVDCPDRLASNTLTPAVRRLGENVLLAVAVISRCEEERETGDGSKWELASREAECWSILHRVRADIGSTDRPNDLRPNVPEGADIPNWMSGTLLRALPPGAALEFVCKARADEQAGAGNPGEEEIYAKAEPYFDAFEAEALFLAGRDTESLDVARRALANLPEPAERLLRGRTAAVASEAARRLGQTDEAREFARRAWTDFPAVFRLLGLAIPVALTDDGSAEAQALVGKLMHSPRVRSDPNGIAMNIAKAGDKLRLTVIRKGREDAEGVALEDPAKALAKAHHLLLSPRRLDAVEINALDAQAAAVKARESLENGMKPLKPNKK